jgi:hypothetical protein
MPDGRVERHRLTPFAVVAGETITYPGGLEAPNAE